MKVVIEKLEDALDLPLPQYATSGSSGMDLLANVKGDLIIKPFSIQVISAGIKICHFPEYFELQVRSCSGLSIKHGVIVSNAPATIDSDYRGEIKVVLINLGDCDFVVTRGMRIAQVVVARYEKVYLEEVSENSKVSDTERGEKGFGSSGLYS